MATWEEIQGRLRRLAGGEVRSVSVSDGEVRVSWRFSGNPGAVDLDETVRPFEALGEGWIAISGHVRDSVSFPDRRALEHTATLAIGAVALGDDGYVVRHVMPMARLVLEELDQAVAIVAHEAAFIRVALAAEGAAELTFYSHFAE